MLTERVKRAIDCISVLASKHDGRKISLKEIKAIGIIYMLSGEDAKHIKRYCDEKHITIYDKLNEVDDKCKEIPKENGLC